MKASSLQQALAKEKVAALGVGTNKNATSTGIFESSFQNGLDLSEFSTPPDAPISASAALLKAKAIERERKQFDEQEEIAMQELAEQRRRTILLNQQQQLQQGSSSEHANDRGGTALLRAKRPTAIGPSSSFMSNPHLSGRSGGFLQLKDGQSTLTSALVGMHQTDTTEQKTSKLRRDTDRQQRLKGKTRIITTTKNGSANAGSSSLSSLSRIEKSTCRSPVTRGNKMRQHVPKKKSFHSKY